MRIGLHDVADRAGVSTATVRKIFNGQAHRFAESTKVAVHAAAAELGYLPNSAARSIRKGRFEAVGVVLRHGGSSIDYNILKGVYREASRQDLRVSYAEMEDCGLGGSPETPRLLQELCVDGYIIHHGGELVPEAAERMHRSGFPFIYVNAHGAENCVLPDDVDAVRMGLDALAQRGHRRVVYVQLTESLGNANLLPHDSQEIRAAAFHRVCQQLTIEPATLTLQPSDREALVQAIVDDLGAPHRPTACLCNGFDLAVLVLLAAERLGLRVPDQLSLLCIESPYHVYSSAFQIDTLRVPASAMGSEAVRMLMECLKQECAPLPSRLVTYRHLAGNTLSDARE